MFHYSESCKAATSEPKDGVLDSKQQLLASVRNGVILPHLDVLCDLLRSRPTATWNLLVT